MTDNLDDLYDCMIIIHRPGRTKGYRTTAETIAKSGVVPPYRNLFSLMMIMECLWINMVYNEQKTMV